MQVGGRDADSGQEPSRRAHVDLTLDGLRETLRHARQDMVEAAKPILEAEAKTQAGQAVKVPRFAAYSVWVGRIPKRWKSALKLSIYSDRSELSNETRLEFWIGVAWTSPISPRRIFDFLVSSRRQETISWNNLRLYLPSIRRDRNGIGFQSNSHMKC